MTFPPTPLTSSSPPFSTLTLTFGIELEVILAFHQSILQSVLAPRTASIQKDLSPELQREWGLHVGDEHRPYLSWGIRDDVRDDHDEPVEAWRPDICKAHLPHRGTSVSSASSANASRSDGSERRGRNVRPYHMEPLLIAQKILQ